jgi:excinuclease ABC subunit C
MPDAIDCFDVSNLGTSIAVGACSRFANGAPDKSMYRKFRIGSVMGQNDVAMIGEIISRRYCEGMSSSSLPDLVLIDGGKSQLSAAKASLRRLGLERIPCISLAKENEEIYLAGLSDPLLLPRRSPALKMLQQLRDEAHRFSINYNKQLRRLAGR